MSTEDNDLKTTPANDPAPTAAETSEQQEQDEAAKLWAEFPDDGAEKQAEKTNGEKISNEFTESQGEVDKDASVGEKDTAGDKQVTPPPADDIWAKASPELRAAHEAEMAALRKTANDAKAHAGRMRKQFETLKGSADRAADSPKSGDTLDQSLADYPEIAGPVKNALAPIEKRLETLDRLEADHRSTQTDEVNRHIQSQQQLLEEAHPGWEAEYVKGPLAKQFYDWIKSPERTVKQVKTVFETNAEHIFDADAAIEVFNAFKADTAGTGPTPGNGQNQELSAKRAAQLDGSRSPKTPGGPARVTGIPREGDPQAIWKAFPDDNADDRLTNRRRA